MRSSDSSPLPRCSFRLNRLDVTERPSLRFAVRQVAVGDCRRIGLPSPEEFGKNPPLHRSPAGILPARGAANPSRLARLCQFCSAELRRPLSGFFFPGSPFCAGLRGRFAAALGLRVGVEPSPAMAAVARQRGIEVIPAVAESLPFAAARFDFALMVVTLCFVDDVPRSLQEAYRVLKPGGAFLVGFIDRPSRLGRRYQSRQADSVFYREAHFYSVAEVVAGMEQVGFKDLSAVQTLFEDKGFGDAAEPVRPGFGQGAFVVLRGNNPGPN